MEQTEDLAPYLNTSEYIDWDHPSIQAWVAERKLSPGLETIQAVFHFVRDEVSHSADIQSKRVTRKASDVLLHREGICYAKSHLFAALLRAHGIPAGIGYQRLIHGDTPDTGYDLHALNTVYLKDLKRWIRLDARGNKPGVDARFSIDREILAFPVRPELDEADYPFNFAAPHPKVLAALERNTDCRVLYDSDLPSEL